MDEHRRHLEEVVIPELRAVMAKHEVGGVLLLAGREASAWRIVMPAWSGLQLEDAPDGSGKAYARLRLNSRTPEARAQSNSTLGMIAHVRDMASDVTNLYGALLRQAKDALKAQGASVNYVRGLGAYPDGRKGG